MAISAIPFVTYASTGNNDSSYLQWDLLAVETTSPPALYFAPLDDSMDITDRFTCPNFLAAVREITRVAYPNPILISDVNWISSFHFDDRGITSFDGIEYFTALILLSSWHNPVTTLDVSNNLLLETLSMSHSLLTTLDVSNNPLLSRLSLFNNQLTTLDVSSNPLLNELSVDNNQLTELDVSNNPLLSWLGIYNNQLTELDVSNNPLLVFLQVDSNQLTELDVSNNSLLSWLGVYNSQLTELDVSNNPLLVFLLVRSNQLTKLDVSNNPNLTQLDVRNNYILTPDNVIGWQYLFDYVEFDHLDKDDHHFFQFSPQRNVGQQPAPGATIQTSATANQVTQNTITINAAVLTTATGQTIEYAINQSGTTAPTTGWQTGLTFTGLTPNTEYFIWARSAANATHDAGSPMASVGITTNNQPPDNGNNNQPPPGNGNQNGNNNQPPPPITPPTGGGTQGSRTTRTPSAPRSNRITSVRVPVSGGNAIRTTTSNNQATLNLPSRTINQLINDAVDSTITFDFSAAENLNTVRLSRAGLNAFAEAELSVQILLPLGAITLNPNVISSTLQQGNEHFITVSIGLAASSSLTPHQRRATNRNEQAYRIAVRRGTEPIINFTEEITITLPHDGDFPAAAWHLDDDGTRTKMPTTYNEEAETVTFTTSDLSVFVVGYDNNPTPVVATPLAEIEPAQLSTQ